MNIIKRSGEEMEFERGKIAAAIRKANETVEDADKLTEARIERIAQQIEDFARTYDRALSVEEIQDLVETKIQEAGAHLVAKKYITYRFIQSLKRQHNTTDGEILTLINCTNGARCVREMDCPPYWLDATCAMICVAMLHAVENECGRSIVVPLMTVPFCSMSSRFTRSQLCIRCA